LPFTPESFLSALYSQEPAIVMAKLREQPADRNRGLAELLKILPRTLPRFRPSPQPLPLKNP